MGRKRIDTQQFLSQWLDNSNCSSLGSLTITQKLLEHAHTLSHAHACTQEVCARPSLHTRRRKTIEISPCLLLPIAPGDFVAIEDLVITFEPDDLINRICNSISIGQDLVIEDTETFYLNLTSLDPAVVINGFSTVNIIDSTGMYV